MAGYSKDSERQNQALRSILEGGTPEKRIFVSMMDKKEEVKGDRKSHLTDIMAEARVPWFCPECDKVMKRKLDDKMWRLFGHCFDCQVIMENKLRITGEYDDWAKKKVLLNQRSFVEEQLQNVDEWKNQGDITFYNQINPDGHSVEKEKWDINKEKIIEQADEAIGHFKELLEKIDLELSQIETKEN